jgi:hypothetical protein
MELLRRGQEGQSSCSIQINKPRLSSERKQMIRSKLGLLSLCAVGLSVMAFSASAAQAEPLAVWLILTLNEKKEVTGLKTGAELPAEVQGSLENNDGSLLSKIVGIKIKFLCTAETLIGVKLEKEGKLTEGGKAKLTGCKTFLNEEEAPECETHSSGQPVGTIISNEVKGLLVLHEPSAGVKEGVMRIEPKGGETFVTLTQGAACPIGNNVPVIGKIYLKDCEGKLTMHLVIHLIEELKALTTLWTISKTAEHVATIDGSKLVFLVGPHLNDPWGGMPG